MPNIFISYSRADESKVSNIVKDIEALGHDAWFDHELSGGQNWWDQILEEIRSADIFVFILSPESRDSTACKREYEYAHALDKPIIPIEVKDGVSTSLLPPALSQIQIVDYLHPDRDAAFRLARALSGITTFKPLPEPLPEPPEVPVSYLGNISQQVESSADLSYQQQSALLVDIKQCLRDSDVNENDAVMLLQKLRKRRDLYASIADEIDSIIANIKKTESVVSETTSDQPIEPESEQEKEQEPSVVQPAVSQVSSNEDSEEVEKDIKHIEKVTIWKKLAMPLVYGLIGMAIFMIIDYFSYSFSYGFEYDFFEFVLSYSVRLELPILGFIPFFIAGLVNKKHMLALLFMIGGATLIGFILGLIGFHPSLGASISTIGASILGLVYGFYLRRKRSILIKD